MCFVADYAFTWHLQCFLREKFAPGFAIAGKTVVTVGSAASDRMTDEHDVMYDGPLQKLYSGFIFQVRAVLRLHHFISSTPLHRLCSGYEMIGD